MVDWNLKFGLFQSFKPLNTGQINKEVPSTNSFLGRALTEFLPPLI